ncbi:pilus assembly FimT family protein [Anabaena sp. UHCC 0399]|uniref:pilus assembly FimT family protein n=1 Tax=Anabaena sp. UHCC 0399 TaxID=3110238 RepID=UPI002B209C7B|nr:prepilin-type N-terminal cleavage/methylation domain-containing protein [Anabaena sp. UHCC 0399]MEA5566150.1 prepilin-type N-terminal cleavage/methylation domain-containing protein [Anabaena sp. UHCC 0399]
MNRLSFKLLHTCIQNQKNQKQNLASRFAVRFAKPEAGFSLIEVIVVVVMIGVLAAILAPNWFRFLSRQRLNKANDTVVAAIQEAQRQAQKTKLSYSVSFTTTSSDKIAQVAIHPSTSAPDSYWKNLGEDVQIQSGSVLLGTNLTAQNTAGSSIAYAGEYNSSTNKQTITFDYMGILPSANFGTPPSGSTEAPGLKIVLAIPNTSSPTSPSSTKRCVIVKTLLGSVLTEKDDKCIEN